MCKPQTVTSCNATLDKTMLTPVTTSESSASEKSRSHEEDHHQSVWKLLGCTIGICGCYMTYGIIQEHLFVKSSSENNMGATFVLLLQCIFNAIVAKLILVLRPSPVEEQQETLSHLTLIKTSACFTAAMLCSNEALQYVSYPTAVLAKSCKLLPTMLIRYLTSPSGSSITMLQEWMGVILITTGVVLFNISRLTSTQKQTTAGIEDSAFGLALLMSSLVMDGLLAFYQSKLKSSNVHNVREPTAMESMFWSNWYAIFFFAPLAYAMNQWSSGIQALPNYWKAILILNVMAAVGQIFIHYTIYWFSPLMCNTITTTRKFFTILFSVYQFGHIITFTQWICITLVFTGLYAQIGSKYYNQKQQQKQKEA